MLELLEYTVASVLRDSGRDEHRSSERYSLSWCSDDFDGDGRLLSEISCRSLQIG